MTDAFKLVWQFAKESSKHIANGLKIVTPAEYMVRINHCFECKELIPEEKRCGVCGCKMEIKAQWQTSECPLANPKWKANVKKDKEGDHPTAGH